MTRRVRTGDAGARTLLLVPWVRYGVAIASVLACGRVTIDAAAASPAVPAWLAPSQGDVPAGASKRAPQADFSVLRLGDFDELGRLEGHRVEVAADGRRYRIVDVAGEGAPLVGTVERRGRELWLRPERGPARRLGGPLAVPRIAGPGYKVWVIGRSAPDGSFIARRLGVLAPPVAGAGPPRPAHSR